MDNPWLAPDERRLFYPQWLRRDPENALRWVIDNDRESVGEAVRNLLVYGNPMWLDDWHQRQSDGEVRKIYEAEVARKK